MKNYKSHGLTSSGLPTNMAHTFSAVPAVTHPRSTFDRSSTRKLTLDPNYLVPIYDDQVYPGDTIQVKANLFGRILAPLKQPIMDNIYLDWFAFFVPYRLLWANFIHMMGEQDNPTDPIPSTYNIPLLVPPSGGWTLHSLGDYFGAIGAVLGAGFPNVSCFKFRAYNKLAYDWFKDQNFIVSPFITTGDGPDAGADYPLIVRRKRHDMFTSMLPFAQKFGQVSIPVSSDPIPVIFPTGVPSSVSDVYNITQNKDDGSLRYDPTAGLYLTGSTGGDNPGDISTIYGSSADPGNVYADGSAVNAFTINQLRLGITMQQLAEIDMRSGTRFIESNLAHFGVVSPDARLQRSEYLGGGTIPINVHPIAQTSESGTTPQGTLAAFSTLNGSVNFTQSFTEHGVVMVIAEIRADLTYWQGIDHDMCAENTRYDLYFPVFANIGEQPYASKEIYCSGTPGPGDDDSVFGYQEPFAHLRYKPSKIMGYFRPDAPGSLDFYHLSQDFGSRPTLGSTFILDNMPIGRVVTYDESPFFILDSFWMNRSTRVLPTFGVPGLLRL